MKRKYIMSNVKPDDDTFIQVPKHVYLITNTSTFRLYVWLCDHKHGFDMNEYFIANSPIKMDYRVFRKKILELEKMGLIRLSSPTNSSSTNSITTTIDIVWELTNKNRNQKKRKSEVNS